MLMMLIIDLQTKKNESHIKNVTFDGVFEGIDINYFLLLYSRFFIYWFRCQKLVFILFIFCVYYAICIKYKFSTSVSEVK